MNETFSELMNGVAKWREQRIENHMYLESGCL